MAAQDAVTLSMPQVLDLALNSPEIGAINFNILHNFLHVMVQQLQMSTTNIEFRGKDGEKIKNLLKFGTNRPVGVLLTEFNVKSDNKGQKTRTEVPSIEKGGKAATPPEQKQDVLVVIEPDETKPPQLTICMSQRTITTIQDDITDLKQHIAELMDLPKNCSLLDAMKNKDKPVLEIFQVMSLAKRVDAAESQLKKIGSLIEDLTGEIQYVQLQSIEGYDDGSLMPDGSPRPLSPRGKPGSPRPGSPRPGTQKPGSPAHDAPAFDSPEAGQQETDQKDEKSKQVGAKTKSATEGEVEEKQEKGANKQESDKAQHAEQSAVKVKTSPVKKEQKHHQPGQEEGRRVSDVQDGEQKRHSLNISIKRPPPELVIKIGNSEKRLQAIEDTLNAYGIPPPIVPLIKYPSRVDLPPINLNKSFLYGGKASPTQSPYGQLESTSSPQGQINPERDSMSPGQSPQQIRPGSPTKVPMSSKVSPPGKKVARLDEDVSKLPTNDAVAALQKDINKMKREIKKLKGGIGFSRDTDDSAPPSRADKKRKEVKKIGIMAPDVDLEARVKDSAETIMSMDQNFNNQMLALQNQFSLLEQEVNGITEKLTATLPGGDSGVESIGDLCRKVQAMQIDMENIAETTAALVDDQASKKSTFENMNETIELLKTIKADKEDLEDALADKADKCAINRKVSHDQFDTACDELSRGIEEALEKLTTQELLWQQTLDEIQFEISNKLDKMELGPLRDFINNKLRMLQERMKSLTALKKEQEAAGTKSKFLRNVNCISCDKDVVMRKQMDVALMPQPRALPPNRSMAPYLAYELDALRKQQKTSANSRNLNHFESAITGGKSPRMDDHVCNRYCGGSHTVTTPQQRVTRMGHFLAQWGPGAVPATPDIIPTKEEPKQERKPSLTEHGASGDEKKVPEKETAPEVAPHGEKRHSKSSIRSGSAPHLASSATKTPTEAHKEPSLPADAGPSGDEKGSGSAAGSQGKVKSQGGSAKGSQRGSQSSAKRGSKVSTASASKGSKRGSKEGVPVAEKPKEVPEEIPEETPSEVADAEASPPKEPSDGMPEDTKEETTELPEVEDEAAPTSHGDDEVVNAEPEE